MALTELDELKSHWANKYPNVIVTVHANDINTRFIGKMMSGEHYMDINADSIGAVISQCEGFFRRMNKDDT